MPRVVINGQEVELTESERLNGIQVARRVGIDIPHYCWHPGLTVVASCRMCLVESGRKDPDSGEISMLPKLVPACQTPASDGTVFVTDSEKVRQARALVEEDLLIDHPIDCPICDKAGECYLQDYHFAHGRSARRADLKPFTSRRRPMGDTVTLFVDRCVMCSRCVRFTREITGTGELMVINRGSHEEIDVFPGYPLDNKMSGNVVDLCPVGALGDKDFLYSQRVWFMKKHESVCTGCSTGCNIFVEQNQDRIYRLKPRENPHVNEWWMCDEGRYGFKHVHDPRRVVEPRRRDSEGQYDKVEWSDLPAELDKRLREAGSLAAVISPHLTVEEAYLVAKYARRVDPHALLALGPVPTSENDETFPNGFTIRAEKCPNRRGVELILAHFGEGVLSFEDFLSRIRSESPAAIWFAGGYKTNWCEEQTAALLAASLLVVQDLFAGPAWEVARYQLPGVAFAERSGSYVNSTGRLQSFDWAIRPPAGAMSDGQLFWWLLGQDSLYSARRVLDEIAHEIAPFETAAGSVPELGVELSFSEMAEA